MNIKTEEQFNLTKFHSLDFLLRRFIKVGYLYYN